MSHRKQLATIRNNFFVTITKDLELKEDNSGNSDTLEDVLKVFNAHLSVERIRRNIKINENFFLKKVIEDLVRKISFKATPVGDIPADMLKPTVDIHLPFITKIINLSFVPDDIKLAEISPVYKKKDDLHKENYRSVSVLYVKGL